MTSWLTTKIPSPQIIVGAAVSAYVTYYFVNSDECNVYFRYLYYYRIVGPTKFDKNGNAIPQYELKRKMTTSKNKKFTSGQNKTQTKKKFYFNLVKEKRKYGREKTLDFSMDV